MQQCKQTKHLYLKWSTFCPVTKAKTQGYFNDLVVETDS